VRAPDYLLIAPGARRKWRGAALLVCSILLLAASGARGDYRLGSVDLNGRCQSLGYDEAVLTGPISGSEAAYGWRCATGSTVESVDVTGACRWQYEVPDAFALPSDVDEAYSWRCYQPDPSPSSVAQLPPITYHAFDGHTETLVPWRGEEVALLSDPAAERDPAVMRNLLSALDRAYRFYSTAMGREPTPYFTLEGRTTIAQVTSTCGAGCGYLGFTGIEIASGYFEGMYEQAKSNLYDQIPFYELGRNFWFYGSQLAFRPPQQDPVTAGFAVWMRFESMDAARVGGDLQLEKMRSQMESLVDAYDANPSLTFSQTLAENKSPGPLNGTDFWASIMTRLADLYGGEQFIERFFERAPGLPVAESTADAVTNWVRASSYAACADLTDFFYLRWGFPQPDGTVEDRVAASSVPFPAPEACPELPSGSEPTSSPPVPEAQGGGEATTGTGDLASGTGHRAARCRAARAELRRLRRLLHRPHPPKRRQLLRQKRHRAEARARAAC
jgi:hypothetical protein